MFTHRELFTKYAKEGGRYRLGNFGDWRIDEGLYQCECCKMYGALGDEVRYLGDRDIIGCYDCIVRAWGWVDEDLYVEVDCLKDDILSSLLNLAKKYEPNVTDKRLTTYGYEQNGISKCLRSKGKIHEQ